MSTQNTDKLTFEDIKILYKQARQEELMKLSNYFYDKEQEGFSVHGSMKGKRQGSSRYKGGGKLPNIYDLSN